VKRKTDNGQRHRKIKKEGRKRLLNSIGLLVEILVYSLGVYVLIAFFASDELEPSTYIVGAGVIAIVAIKVMKIINSLKEAPER